MASLGLEAGDFVADEFAVFPENWTSVMVFRAMTTQWLVAFRGATGLNYAVLPLVMRWLGVKKKEQPDVFGCIRIMEAETLAVARENG